MPPRTREDLESLETGELRRALKEMQREWKQLANDLAIPNDRFHELDREIDLIERILADRGRRG